jgi:hypothetical protein
MQKHIPKTKHADREDATSLPFLADSVISTAVSQAGATWVRACLEYQREVARFASARIEGDIEHLRSVTQCRNPADLLRLQGEWTTATLSDYAHEARQLMQIASAAVHEGISTTREAAEASTTARD